MKISNLKSVNPVRFLCGLVCLSFVFYPGQYLYTFSSINNVKNVEKILAVKSAFADDKLESSAKKTEDQFSSSSDFKHTKENGFSSLTSYYPSGNSLIPSKAKSFLGNSNSLVSPLSPIFDEKKLSSLDFSSSINNYPYSSYSRYVNLEKQKLTSFFNHNNGTKTFKKTSVSVVFLFSFYLLMTSLFSIITLRSFIQLNLNANPYDTSNSPPWVTKFFKATDFLVRSGRTFEWESMYSQFKDESRESFNKRFSDAKDSYNSYIDIPIPIIGPLLRRFAILINRKPEWIFFTIKENIRKRNSQKLGVEFIPREWVGRKNYRVYFGFDLWQYILFFGISAGLSQMGNMFGGRIFYAPHKWRWTEWRWKSQQYWLDDNLKIHSRMINYPKTLNSFFFESEPISSQSNLYRRTLESWGDNPNLDISLPYLSNSNISTSMTYNPFSNFRISGRELPVLVSPMQDSAVSNEGGSHQHLLNFINAENGIESDDFISLISCPIEWSGYASAHISDFFIKGINEDRINLIDADKFVRKLKQTESERLKLPLVPQRQGSTGWSVSNNFDTNCIREGDFDATRSGSRSSLVRFPKLNIISDGPRLNDPVKQFIYSFNKKKSDLSDLSLFELTSKLEGQNFYPYTGSIEHFNSIGNKTELTIALNIAFEQQMFKEKYDVVLPEWVFSGFDLEPSSSNNASLMLWAKQIYQMNDYPWELKASEWDLTGTWFGDNSPSPNPSNFSGQFFEDSVSFVNPKYVSSSKVFFSNSKLLAKVKVVISQSVQYLLNVIQLKHSFNLKEFISLFTFSGTGSISSLIQNNNERDIPFNYSSHFVMEGSGDEDSNSPEFNSEFSNSKYIPSTMNSWDYNDYSSGSSSEKVLPDQAHYFNWWRDLPMENINPTANNSKIVPGRFDLFSELLSEKNDSLIFPFFKNKGIENYIREDSCFVDGVVNEKMGHLVCNLGPVDTFDDFFDQNLQTSSFKGDRFRFGLMKSSINPSNHSYEFLDSNDSNNQLRAFSSIIKGLKKYDYDNGSFKDFDSVYDFIGTTSQGEFRLSSAPLITEDPEFYKHSQIVGSNRFNEYYRLALPYAINDPAQRFNAPSDSDIFLLSEIKSGLFNGSNLDSLGESSFKRFDSYHFYPLFGFNSKVFNDSYGGSSIIESLRKPSQISSEVGTNDFFTATEDVPYESFPDFTYKENIPVEIRDIWDNHSNKYDPILMEEDIFKSSDVFGSWGRSPSTQGSRTLINELPTYHFPYKDSITNKSMLKEYNIDWITKTSLQRLLNLFNQPYSYKNLNLSTGYVNPRNEYFHLFNNSAEDLSRTLKTSEFYSGNNSFFVGQELTNSQKNEVFGNWKIYNNSDSFENYKIKHIISHIIEYLLWFIYEYILNPNAFNKIKLLFSKLKNKYFETERGQNSEDYFDLSLNNIYFRQKTNYRDSFKNSFFDLNSSVNKHNINGDFNSSLTSAIDTNLVFKEQSKKLSSILSKNEYQKTIDYMPNGSFSRDLDLGEKKVFWEELVVSDWERSLMFIKEFNLLPEEDLNRLLQLGPDFWYQEKNNPSFVEKNSMLEMINSLTDLYKNIYKL